VAVLELDAGGAWRILLNAAHVLWIHCNDVTVVIGEGTKIDAHPVVLKRAVGFLLWRLKPKATTTA
jgi:hypothetical protein